MATTATTKNAVEPDARHPSATQRQDDLEVLLAARQRHQRRRTWAMNPSGRMQAMQAILAQSWAILQANPIALAHFRSRNHRKRAISTPESPCHGA